MVELGPEVVVWEYTLGCDSKCIHCGSDAKNPRKNELSTSESLDLVDQIADLKFKLVVLSGGEPTLRKDFSKIGEKIIARGLEFGIISNALAWTGTTIDCLDSLKAYSVGFSVDGEKELHDKLRGYNGSHEKVFWAIKELKKKDNPVCVITAVNKDNLGQLGQIRNRLIVYGVDAWQIQMASPMGRMIKNIGLVLNEEEYYKLGQFVAETRDRLPWMNVQAADCMGYYGTLGGKVRDREWNGCHAGIEGLGIESDGNVKGCLSIRTPSAIEGNVREQSLKDIWWSATNFKYNRNFDLSALKGQCVGCDYGERCRGGCQSQSIAFFKEFHNAPYCFLRHERNKNVKK